MAVLLQQDEFQQELEKAVSTLLYPSETDAPLKLHRFEANRFPGGFGTDELHSLFFSGKKPETLVAERMAGLTSEGYLRFFRHFTDFITWDAQGGYLLRMPSERENVLQWRRLRDLWNDYLISGNWFKASLADGVRKRVFITGQFLNLTFRPETNELASCPGDWFVLETELIET